MEKLTSITGGYGTLLKKFSSFDLEDKVEFKGGALMQARIFYTCYSVFRTSYSEKGSPVRCDWGAHWEQSGAVAVKWIAGLGRVAV